MSTFASSFKQEVIRLARKEAKAAVAPVRKPSVAARSAIADLKRRVAALERDNRRLGALVAKIPQPQVESAKAKGWITGKGMRSFRKKLRLTGQEFAKLLGVSMMTVYQWERKNGALRVRDTTRAAILAVRGLGAREAKARLAALKPASKRGRKGQ